MKMTNSRFLKSDFWLDMLFPNRCPCCKKVISWDVQVCEQCRSTLPYLDETPWQLRYPDGVGGDKILFDYAVSAFSYESPAVEGIYCLKGGRGTNFARFSVGIICDKLENDGITADIITCVPMAKKKKKYRGYNQAEVIAGYLSRSTGIECDFKLLKRKPVSLEQHTLNASERHRLADEIYYINSEHCDISGKSIIICDDVFTTGATMNKCAGLLKSIGAKAVYCATICCTEKKIPIGEE